MVGNVGLSISRPRRGNDKKGGKIRCHYHAYYARDVIPTRRAVSPKKHQREERSTGAGSKSANCKTSSIVATGRASKII